MNDQKFIKEERHALGEIRAALLKQLNDLAQSTSKNYDANTADMPKHIKMQETFRMNAVALAVVTDLLHDKPLNKAFEHVSGRYEPVRKKPAAGLPEDMKMSDTAKQDGRASAFEKVSRALDIAERDFDMSYKELDRAQIAYWKKKHPTMPDQSLQDAYKGNQRHFMKESLNELRSMINGVKAAKPSGRAKPPTP